MPKKTVLLMIGVVMAGLLGMIAYKFWAFSPDAERYILAAGFVAFFLMVVSKIMLRRHNKRMQSDGPTARR